MRKRLLYILLLMTISVAGAFAQTDTIRYVNAKTGKYANDGKTWATAKDNVQDAINDLYNYMQTQNVHSGSVYVAAGTYAPSESTGDGSSVLSTSFKIYDGIHVYGGFDADKPEATPDLRILSTQPAWRDGQSGLANDKQSTGDEKTITIGELEEKEKTEGATVMRYDFKNATIFSGNHNTVMGTFKWNDNKKQYDTRFPGNSYHVVWFATNGYVKDAKGNNTLYADSLVYGASLDGCIIQDGNASGRSTDDRDLNAFGGGVYMVQHATVRNCVIRRCSASRRGGGVYMDRGGTVKDCNIYQCQTLGIGVIDGYGGGVCMENNGVMRHCNVTNNMARTGGGLMIVYAPEKHPYSTKYTKDDFDPFASVCVFSNNNANTEGAGVVLYRGGVLNHCTIVNNECTGTDITIGGVRYGRTGGLFIYGAGSAFNSVVWGNTCAANDNIQYGYYATTDLYAKATAQRPRLGYMAFSNFDITDWGNTLRSNVFQISKENFTSGKAGNYPIFTSPSTTAGANGATASPLDWMPNPMSYLQQKGVQVSQLNNFGNIITKSHSAKDFVRNVFDPVSALGAFAITDEQYVIAELPAVDGSNPDVKIPTLFVDPNRVVKDKNVTTSGSSWDTPLDNVSEAVKDMGEYIKQHNVTSKTQILVKQGNITTAGSSSYLYDTTTGEADLESAALHLLSNMLMYGGYSSSLKGTDVNLRNPKENVTRINGNIVGEYKYNSVHCVIFPNVHDAVLDGFYISYGNAEKPDSPEYNNDDKEGSYSYRQAYGYGAGIFIGARSRSDRNDDMKRNIVRNCVISNCWAPMGGAAVFVSGDNYLKNSSQLQRAELTMENCIIHNNGVRNKQKNTVKQWRASAGIIEAVGNATITMKHCTVVNNVGTVFSAYNHKGGNATISVTNSAIYSNATDSLTDRTQLKTDGSNLAALYYNGANGNAPTGSNNQIDTLYYKHTGLSSDLKKLFIPIFGNDRANDHTYPRFVNPVRTIFVQRNADDPTLYGGTIDYTPMNMNPMVNAASVADGEDVKTETDFVLNHRNYGGKPDVGAIENTTQPLNGSTYFVRTTGSDSNDGLSWATAFKTIGHALQVASSGKKSVWVAKGVYKENLIMQDGVNVYGGFKSYGNPGKREGERDISNLDSTYQTIIDGQYKGHVLNQNANFSNATLWEGITIQNGTNLVPTSMGSVSTITEKITNTGSSNWSKGTYGTKVTKTITRTFTSQYTLNYNRWWNSVLLYGGGAYILKNATLKNCLIRYNHYFQSWPSSITVKVAPTTTYTTTIITKASADAKEVSVTKDSVSNVPYMTYETPSSASTFGSDLQKGGSGIYLGSGAVLENCVVRNNEGKIYNNDKRMVGCGILSDGGTVLNSLIVENYTTGGNCLGVAMYLKTKSFIYNTTIAYNLVTNISDLPCCPGVWDAAARGDDPNFAVNCSKFYNTIFWANIGYGNTAENFNQVCRSSYRAAIGKTGHMINCYHSVPGPKFGNAGVTQNNNNVSITDLTQIYSTGTITSTDVSSNNAVNIGVNAANTNTYYTKCKSRNLFNESNYIYPTASGSTQISSIETDNPYSINRASDLAQYCINMGADEGEMLKVTEDIAGADRIQDCRIDKGAYEYNGASKIEPEPGTETHRVYKDKYDMTGEEKVFNVATFYVSQNGGGGVADASSAANAACSSKLQQVLDAAGRYKYANPTHHVVVKLAAFPGGGGYAPSRTTDYNTNVDINPRQFSIQIPRGVEVQGGWDEDFKKRDPLNNKTLLTGTFNYDRSTSTAYHVVTFTDYVFDENGNRISKGKDADGLPIYKLLSDKFTTYKATWEKTPGDSIFSRSLINGCYIENGQADGVLPENQRGGAAVVTSFADISNCVIQNNSASGYGGGLYVEPSGIVSGCILQDNEAANGAGIAIDEPDSTSLATWAILAYNTIVYNNATSNGGGIFFNTNLRSIGNVVWMNTSSDQSDIAGVVNVDATQDVWNFPVNYTAVTNVREAGVNNISVNSLSDAGVRWQADSKLKTDTRQYQYYALQKSSVLTRAALPYTTMRNMLRFFPGIDSVDIAGVKRMEQTATDPVQFAYDGTGLEGKDNVTTDIGARAINFAFKIQADKVFYRLFVVHPTNVSNSNANALLESGDEIYKQVGSSFANPFQRLGDAFDYIMNVRKRKETSGDTTPEKDKPRNHRFEVFVAGGTYYPYTDMYGNQGDVRSNTFNIPEGVTVIGGIDVSKPEHMYCQETSGKKEVGDVTLYGSTTDEIRNQRVRYDINKNSVVEPWEMKSQTILSGLSVGSDLQVKNVYHVINCNADEKSVGKLPKYFSDDNLTNTTMDATKESTASRLNRTIILDGLTIRDGSAMGYETTVQNKEWYYRGGGIFIDGTTIADKEVDTKTGMETPMRSIPMVVSNTLFQNNSARLGGAIYTNGQLDVVGCSFVQNYSKSPDETDTEDCANVAWSGGGAIATNDEVTIVNSIFANNEAKKGTGKLTKHTDGNGKTNNETLGYGGVLWAGDNSSIAILNCNSVRNKAHSFPSIYNTMPNSSEPTKTHIAVNSIFWGNEVDEGGNLKLANFGSDQDEALFFCAYQDKHGQTVKSSTVDLRDKEVTYNDLGNLFSFLGETNNNVIISDNNEAVDGPNFILPSSKAGVDGYMQSADWLISRVNLLTDAGWGEIDQDEKGNYKTGSDGDYEAHGIYPLLSKYYKSNFKLTLLPLGKDKYMNYADDKSEESTENMNRISADPLGNTTKDYIDIGVYEYQHSQLTVADGDSIDVMWVSDEEKTGANTADGRSWDTPTSDLQRAIETLLLSRNDKPKVVKIMGGTYSPTYTLDESNNGFQIHTGANDGMVALKKKIISGHDYQAKSLTIEGGYSKEIVGARDIEQNPTILEMANKSTSTADNMAHLFFISDAEQWETQGNRSGSSTPEEEIDVTQSSINKSSKSTGKAMPITFDGLTFVNNYASATHTESKGTNIGGAAIYYKEQFKTTETGAGATGTKSTTDHLDAIGGVPKLTIKNCIFQQNGATGATTVPAVRIEKGGGRTLIYNSVFHSGSGNPLESTDTVSIVNCTFAMNGGHIKLSDKATGTSTLYNSIIWKDDQNNNMTTQYEGFSKDNAATDSVQYNAITGIENTEEDDAHHHNVGLDDRNYNAMEGPNFVNGDGKDVSQRDYHINPGVRTLTRASYMLYAREVLGWKPNLIIKTKWGNDTTLTDEIIQKLLADTAYTKDLANKVRLYDGSMERGAYECSSAMQRVLFVDPVKINTNKTTGLSWENAYGSGSIQRAIDAAAVYTYFNKNVTDAQQAKSYVFVKGANNDNATPEAITLRNGVSVYGSIASGYTEEPEATKDKETGNVLYNNGARTFVNTAIDDYIKKVKASRPGLAAKTTHRTRVASISTMAMKTGYGFGALVDGVEVRDDKTKTITDPVINIKDPIDGLVMRNMLIDGNTVSENNGSGAPVVNLQYGLLYNALLYGNTAAANQPIVSVGTNATMLNCTVVAEAAGQKTVDNAGSVINCIDFNRIDNQSETSGSGTYTNCYSATGNPFAPYLRADGNVYKLPAFLTDHAPYYYQLHESSKAINAGNNGGVPDKFKDYVDFSTDRDILGNPRTLGGTVDMGCFETWSIAEGQARYATADNNHYPHEGSVVYIGKNASLSLGADASTKIFTGENAFMPGYLLLKSGASLYGNGNIIRAAYVAAERSFPEGTQYSLMSMPFPYDYANALTTATDGNGNISEAKYSIPKGKTYDGEKRSAWDYDFHTSDSPCWEAMASTKVNACDGWLLNLGSPLTDAVDIRFTSFSSKDGDYVYSEDGKAKTVTLTQYNTTPNDGSAHFTKLENMGWNLKGMPWLVSGYNTAGDVSGKYNMNVPHVFYTVSEDGNKFTTSRSWYSGDRPPLDFGSAFFTQTAIIGDKNTEKVTFALPAMPSGTISPAAKPFVTVSDDDGSSDAVEVVPSSTASTAPIAPIASMSPSSTRASKALVFNLGSDGVKWQSFNDSVPQLYLLDDNGVALSLAGNAPVGVEMAMGYRAAKDGRLTVSLPDAEAFDGLSVWLKDKATGDVVDLTQDSYSLNTAKGYTDNRLTLTIGGIRPDGTKSHGSDGNSSWTVRGVNGCLVVSGLTAGDKVSVYYVDGAMVEHGIADTETYTTGNLDQGVYIVRVNGSSKKISLRLR